jgi:hypothetical protein
VGARIGLLDQVGQLAQLGVGELAPRTGHRLGAQRLGPLGAPLGQPGVDRLRMRAESGQAAADLGGRRAGVDLFHRAQPDRLQRLVVELAAVVVAHYSKRHRAESEVKLPAIPLELVSRG